MVATKGSFRLVIKDFPTEAAPPFSILICPAKPAVWVPPLVTSSAISLIFCWASSKPKVLDKPPIPNLFNALWMPAIAVPERPKALAISCSCSSLSSAVLSKVFVKESWVLNSFSTVLRASICLFINSWDAPACWSWAILFWSKTLLSSSSFCLDLILAWMLTNSFSDNLLIPAWSSLNFWAKEVKPLNVLLVSLRAVFWLDISPTTALNAPTKSLKLSPISLKRRWAPAKASDSLWASVTALVTLLTLKFAKGLVSPNLL